MIKRKRPEKHGKHTEKGKKSKIEGKLRCKSGISIRSDIGFSLEKESASYFPVLQMIITVAAALSSIYMLQSYFLDRECVYPISRPDTLFLSIVMTALSALMISRGKPFFKIAGFAFIVMNVIYIVSHSNEVAMGFMYTVNFPILFLVTFFMFEIGAFKGWKPAIWTVVVMIICWVTILSISLINHTTKRTSKSNFAVSLKKKSFYLTSNDIKLKFFSTHTLAVIVAATFAFVCAAIGSKDNYRPDNLRAIRRANTQKFEEFVIKAQKGRLKSAAIPGRSMMIGGTNGGQMLGSSPKIQLNDNIQLKVSCDPFTRTIYLRGYAAEIYEPDRSNSDYYSWNPLELEKNLIDQFTEDGARSLDYNYFENLINAQVLGSAPSKMRIYSVNAAPDVLYAPTCAYYSGCELVQDETQDFDGMITPNKVHETYTLETFAPYSDFSWDEILGYADGFAKMDGFEDRYSYYTDYIYSKRTYTEIPEELEPVITDLIKAAKVDTSTDSVTIIKTKIKRYLAEQGFTYSTEPGVTFDGGDFIKQFLEGKSGGKGFCQHYASTGVMVMRRLGYPARYAEGYIIEPKQQQEDQSWITVTTRCAHAWCEIYIKGYGWYPIEFTPGYTSTDNPNLTENDLKELMSDSSSDEEPEESSEPEQKKEDSSSKKKKKDKDSSEEVSSSEADTPIDSSTAPILAVGAADDDSGDGSEVVVVEDGNNGGGGVGGDGGGITMTRGQITYMLMMILFIVGFAAAVVVRRRHILNELEQSINSRSGSKSVISCYTALLRYISLLGIKNDTSLTDVQLSSRITTELGVMSPELNSIFMEISEPAITCYMSGIESDSETAERSRKLLRAAQKNIFGRLNFLGRFSARWISGLY